MKKALKENSPCWDGYKQVGMKMKDGKEVPNCVPESVEVNEENVPNDPALWSRAKAAAKSKFDVYPSAYANGWAAKWYKEKGGTWKTKSESVNEINLKSVGVKEFLNQLMKNQSLIKKLGFKTMKDVLAYIQGGGLEDWYDLKNDGKKLGMAVNEANDSGFEIGDFVHFKSKNKTGMVKKIVGDKVTILTMKGDFTGDIKDIQVLYQDNVNERLDKTHLGILKYAYKDIDKINPSDPAYARLVAHLDKMSKDELKQIAGADIKFLSLLAKNRLMRNEDHSSDPNDKYIVRPCKNPKEPWAVWEGEVRVKGFATREEAQAYADAQNKAQGLTEAENPTDTITMDVPLFLRMLEFAKEDAQTDMDLHKVTEKSVSLSKQGDTLTMDNYDTIVSEGNAFTGALYQARKEGKKEFEFNGKTYPVQEAKDETIEEGIKMKKLHEGSFSEIDIMAREARNFNDFVKEFYKDYKDFPKDKETIKWLKSLYDGRSRDESVNEIRRGSIVIPYAMDKDGEFIVDKVFKNKAGETSYTGKFKKSGEAREFILHSKDKIVKESVNEGISPKDMETIKSAVTSASSFMNIGATLKKTGLRYIFATSPMPIYIVQDKSGNRVGIVNKKYATKPDFVHGDTAVGVMESKSLKEFDATTYRKKQDFVIGRKFAEVASDSDVELMARLKRANSEHEWQLKQNIKSMDHLYKKYKIQSSKGVEK